MTELPADNIDELVEQYATHHEAIEGFITAWRSAKARLQSYVLETGPQVTSSGARVTVAANGYYWSEEAIDKVAMQYPALVTEATVTVTVSNRSEAPPAIERARDIAAMALEFDPTCEVSWNKTLDKREVNEYIREGGAAGRFLGELREARGRLAVKAAKR